MELQNYAIIFFIPTFVFMFAYIILLKKFLLKLSGKEDVSVWTGINKKTKKLAVTEYKSGKEIFDETKLGQSLILGVLFSNKYSNKYPNEIRKLRIFGYSALILGLIAIVLIFIVVFQANI